MSHSISCSFKNDMLVGQSVDLTVCHELLVGHNGIFIGWFWTPEVLPSKLVSLSTSQSTMGFWLVISLFTLVDVALQNFFIRRWCIGWSDGRPDSLPWVAGRSCCCFLWFMLHSRSFSFEDDLWVSQSVNVTVWDKFFLGHIAITIGSCRTP